MIGEPGSVGGGPSPRRGPGPANDFAVAVSGDGQRVAIRAFRIGLMLGLPPLTREQALNLAAWLVVLLDPNLQEIQPLIESIKRG